MLEGDVEPFSVEEPIEDVQEFEAEALNLAQIGTDAKWKVIEDYMNDRIAFFRDDLAEMDIKGLDLAQVGEKYLVCSLVAMEMEALMSKIRVTTEAVNDSRKRNS